MVRARMGCCEAWKFVKRCFAGMRVRLDAIVGDGVSPRGVDGAEWRIQR
jgi:hypothetical protein